MKKDFYNKKVIINCKFCKVKLRIPLFQKNVLMVTCNHCKNKFKFNGSKYRAMVATRAIVFYLLMVLSIVSIILIPACGIYLVNNKKQLWTETNKGRIKEYKEKMEADIARVAEEYSQVIKATDIDMLRKSAKNNYDQIWIERNNYNTRYALSDREKTQLKMIALAKNSAGGVHSIIREIAQMASPKNSEIDIDRVLNGVLALSVNFHMSDLTKGEDGTSTKHQTIKSLKNEATRLSSKVTNDVYVACKDLDLDEIYIGCKHLVLTTDRYGNSSTDEEMVIYKVVVVKEDVKKLTHNPFLDIYSVAEYIKVVEDNFPSLRIVSK